MVRRPGVKPAERNAQSDLDTLPLLGEGWAAGSTPVRGTVRVEPVRQEQLTVGPVKDWNLPGPPRRLRGLAG